jgi:hypothetical protein
MAIKSQTETLHASGTEITSGSGSGVDCKSNAGAVYLDVTAFGNSPDTLDVVVEERQGGRWYTVATFAQVGNALATEKVALSGYYGNILRASWTLSGGSPGFEFKVTFAGETT